MSEDAHGIELPAPYPQQGEPVKNASPENQMPVCSMCNDTGWSLIDGSQCICVLYGHNQAR